MPFPQIRACLIAEDAREERYGKVTILGLYSLAPHVEIGVREMTRPVSPLTFILIGSEGEGGYRVGIRVVSEQEDEVVRTPPAAIDIPRGRGGGSNIILTINQVQFPRVGLYRFILEVDGERHFETTFRVRQALPEEFR